FGPPAADQDVPNGLMFGGIKDEGLEQAVLNGDKPMSRLDDVVHRILRAIFAAGVFDHPAASSAMDATADEAVAQEAEEQGFVLLKNAAGQLPLNTSKSTS